VSDRERLHGFTIDPAVLDDMGMPEPVAALKTFEEVGEAVDRLDEPYRELVEAFYYERRSIRSIANTFGWSRHKVKTTLEVATSLLAVDLEVDTDG